MPRAKRERPLSGALAWRAAVAAQLCIAFAVGLEDGRSELGWRHELEFRPVDAFQDALLDVDV